MPKRKVRIHREDAIAACRGAISEEAAYLRYCVRRYRATGSVHPGCTAKEWGEWYADYITQEKGNAHVH